MPFPTELKNGLSTVLTSTNEIAIRGALLDLITVTRTKLQLGDVSGSLWFDELAAIFDAYDSSCAGEEQIEILQLLVQWYFNKGEWNSAISSATKATAIARRLSAPALLRRALNIEGMLLSRRLELAEATERLAEALDIATRIGDRFGQCSTLVNLAEARFNAGLLHESITLNKHVLCLSSEPYFDSITGIAHHNLAIAYFTLCDFDSALSHIKAAVDLEAHPKSIVWANQRVVLLSTYARILACLGRTEPASRVLDDARKLCEELDSRPARVQLQLSEALCAAVELRAQEAQKKLDQLRNEIKPYETGFRDLLEIELFCERYLQVEDSPSIHRRKYLSHLAQWQRRKAIREVAAIQHSLRPQVAARGPHREKWPAANEPDTKTIHNRLERLDQLAILAELREDATGGHPYRIGKLAYEVSRCLGFDEHSARLIESAARLHDIGKLAVPDVVLLRRGGLEANDRRVIQRHTTEGCQMLADIIASGDHVTGFRKGHEFQVLEMAAQIALQHHERWDGSGYPRQMRAEKIHEAARITAVCDAFDCLVHRRLYRNARTIRESLSEISDLAGHHFDPHIVEALVEVIREARDGLEQSDRRPSRQSGAHAAYFQANELIQQILASARSA